MVQRRLWVGLDVGAESVHACAVDADGAVEFEQEIANSAAELHKVLRPLKRRVNLIGLEGGTYALHLTRSLRRLGYEVAVFDSRQASKFLAIRQNKTDKNDARGLADVARLGCESVAQVRIKSAECQRLRSTLVTRQRLVRLRVGTENSIRSLLRLNGARLKYSQSASSLRRHVEDELKRLRKAEKIDLRADVEPLLALSLAIRTYLEKLDRQLRTTAEQHPICQRFLEIPGVGYISALSFYSAIEEPFRFKRNSDVGPYLGMVPKIRQSGPHTIRMRISKMGSSMTRAHLATAGLQHLRFGDGALHAWGTSLGERIGRPRARVAVARKLAVLMLSMWKSGERYNPNKGLGQLTERSEDCGLMIAA